MHLRRTVAAWLLISGTAVVHAQAPLAVGTRRQLLMDERFVRDARGVEFRVHPPRKTGEVTIAEDEGRGLGGYHSVLKTAGVYHLWYTAGGTVAYARSKDGIHFEKPNLDLGSNGTGNTVFGRGIGGLKGGTHGLYVFLDPKAPAQEKFRMVANPEEFQSFLQLFSSPDGIHWKHTHRDLMVFDTSRKPFHLDTQNVIFWDERLGRYVAYVRRNLRERNSQARSIARAEAPDLSGFGHIRDTQVVFRADGMYPGHFDPRRKVESAVHDVYTNGVIKYPWAEDAYFMFPAVYYHYGAWHREFRAELPVNAGVLDVRFGSSRDGIRWNTYDWRPFVPVGMENDFDSRRIYMVHGVVPGLDEREMYMYYLGTNEVHGWGRDDRNNRVLTAAGVAPQPPRRAISRVVLRRDGFVSVRAGSQGGEFTTPPLVFAGDQLVLNVDTSALGEVQVEIQDAARRPLAGHTLADADIIHSANDINRVVSWNGSSDVAALAGKPVRLRFAVHDADVYAFQFRERPGL